MKGFTFAPTRAFAGLWARSPYKPKKLTVHWLVFLFNTIDTMAYILHIMLRNGVNLGDIQLLVGHSDIGFIWVAMKKA